MNSTFIKTNFLLLAVIVVQIVGFGALWARHSEPETIFIPTGTGATTAADTAGQSIPVTAIKLPDTDSLRASVRSVLQEELRTYVRQASGGVSAQEAEAARIAQDPKGNAEALMQSNAVIDQAVSRRTWTMEDSAALLPNVAKLSESQRIELAQKFHGALNRQELKLMSPPPL